MEGGRERVEGKEGGRRAKGRAKEKGRLKGTRPGWKTTS